MSVLGSTVLNAVSITADTLVIGIGVAAPMPEPSSLVLMAIGMVGSLAYAARTGSLHSVYTLCRTRRTVKQ